MEKQLQEVRDHQKESWNKFSPGWKKWDELMMTFLKPTGDEIIKLLRLKDDDLVLDVAGGTGEPGLTIASQLKNGRVIVTDIAEDMLKIAHENAARRGVNNLETKICDVCELPFDNNSFDAISCRYGFMFFPDMLLAAKEITRVLKPGGRIATSVWNVPEKNFWVTAMGHTINKNMQLPSPNAEVPGMFRCSKSGLIQDLFRQAGLKNVSEIEIPGKLNCETADVYWDMMIDVAAPFVAALSKANDGMKEKIKSEVFELVKQKFPDKVEFETSSLVIFGEK